MFQICGKSILLEQIEEEFVINGFDKTHIIRINFEDLQFEKIRTAEKLNNYISKQIKDKDKYLIFLDDERVIIRTKLEKPSKIKGLELI
ncbi:MAG: AAA family ATPase [Bacteroides sp.]